jgi:GT2 family glycosyltransferase
VILTVNIPETLPFSAAGHGVDLQVVRNSVPRGFGANHNAAFRIAKAPMFCVVNPDIRFHDDPFPPLMSALADRSVAIAAPLVRNRGGAVEDSARAFPTVQGILRKGLGGPQGLDYEVGADPIEPDWVAGMFMLFRGSTFARLGGFDERYFLYYEDVDLCARARLGGQRIVLDPRAEVLHDARRDSRRRPRHAWWHARSMLRYFLSEPFRRLSESGLLRRTPIAHARPQQNDSSAKKAIPDRGHDVERAQD